MTALGIGVTSNEPETNGNNLPSGRLNLKGQQKPSYLLRAIEAEEKAYSEYLRASNTYENNPKLSTSFEMHKARHIYENAFAHLRFCENRWMIESNYVQRDEEDYEVIDERREMRETLQP